MLPLGERLRGGPFRDAQPPTVTTVPRGGFVLVIALLVVTALAIFLILREIARP